MLRRTFAAILVLCMLFSGCTLQRIKNSKNGTKPNGIDEGTSTVSGASTESGADEVRIVDDPTSGVNLPAQSSLGDVNFDTETDKAVTGKVAINKELVLEATDISGAVWTLTVPANAIPAGTTIKLTPLKNIQNAGYIGEMKGGMMFEPDGLEFDVPGTLSIKLPDGTPKALMITGDNQGKNLSLMDGAPGEGTIVSSIEHFSSAYFDTVESLDMQKLQEQTEAEYKDVLERFKEFLKTPIQIPPVQDLTLECLSDKRYTQARIYAYRAMQPEIDYGRELAQVGRKMALLGSEKGSGESLNYLSEIAARLVKKANRILKEAGTDPNKFLAASITALSCYRNASLLNPDSKVPDPGEAVGSYAAKTADYCLSKLRDDHNFKYIRGALEIGRISALLGNGNTADEVLNALVFKLEYTLNLNLVLTDGEKSYNTSFLINGEAEIKYSDSFKGAGQGNYAQLVSNYMGMSAEPFDFNVLISKFDPCETETAVLDFDALTAKSETCWLLSDPSGMTSDPYSKKFLDQLIPPAKGKYVITLPLKNGEEVVCQDTVKKEDKTDISSLTVTIDIKLTHTPK